MAGEWIKMRHRLLGEQEVKAMAVRLRVSRQHVAGCLLAVWSHADQFAVERPDPLQRYKCPAECPGDAGTSGGTGVEATEGFLAFTSLADIDHEAMQPGFAEAMEAVGWLRVYEDGIGFPQYQIHHSSSSKTRASEAKKKQTQRAEKKKSPAKRPAAPGTDVPMSAGQNPDTIEGEREEEGEIQNKNQNKKQKGEVAERTAGAGSGGEARTRSRPATPAVRDEKIPEGGTGGELPPDVALVLGAWDDIGGVSHEHATPGSSGSDLVYDRKILELLKARLRDVHFRDHWRAGLNFVRSSKLCRGMVEPREGFDAPWRATLKWFCSPGNLAKILEGSHGGNAEGLTEEDDDEFFAEQRERALPPRAVTEVPHDPGGIQRLDGSTPGRLEAGAGVVRGDEAGREAAGLAGVGSDTAAPVEDAGGEGDPGDGQQRRD